MKITRTLNLSAVLLCAAVLNVHAQVPAPPAVPTLSFKEQAQAQTKAQMASAQIQYINLLENGFDRVYNLVTVNQYHLSKEEVLVGLGDNAAAVQANGALILGTIIKANRNLGRQDRWLEQPWVQAWVVAYHLDPATGDAAPGS